VSLRSKSIPRDLEKIGYPKSNHLEFKEIGFASPNMSKEMKKPWLHICSRGRW
jgi:hypothetical protein